MSVNIERSGVMGWIASRWQRQPFGFGYSGVIRELVDNLNLSAGANNLDTTAVPAGEVHVITNITIRYDGTPPTQIQAQLRQSGIDYTLWAQTSPVSARTYDRQGRWVLEAGELIRMNIVGATLNNDAYIRITGHRMDIDQ